MNAEISTTILGLGMQIPEKLGLGMQIPEIPAQRNGIRHADS